jgi:hypothetical protein
MTIAPAGPFFVEKSAFKTFACAFGCAVGCAKWCKF